MFKFDFDIEDQDKDVNEFTTAVQADGSPGATNVDHLVEHFSEMLLTQLLDALPPLISYSPLLIPLSSGAQLALSRRDLFDARFQLISESDECDGIAETVPRVNDEEKKGAQSSSALEFVNMPSDLLPGRYEGGLKTWECSLDLVDCLDSLKNSGVYMGVRGQRVLEIGCGTAVPSLYLLHEIFASGPPLKADVETAETQIHLQDYNTSVLGLVTVPNVILAWYLSPSSESYRALESDVVSPFDPSSPGELAISPALKAAFLDSLRVQGLTLRFFAGSWNTFDLTHTGGKYDVVLSSETIYRTQSLDALVELMKGACGRERSLDALTSSQLSLTRSPEPQYLCLVAAKVLYFGVGGGISEFVRAIESPEHKRGKVETVWERKVGVGRNVMRIEWDN